MPKSQKPYERYFNGWAKLYDRDLEKYEYCVPHKIFEITPSFLKEQSSLTLLDIGIGTGLTSAPFKQHNQSILVTGVDVSQKMLTLCYHQKRADNLCRTDVANTALPFISNHFDLIILGGVLEYIADPAVLFSEIKRVLKPNGYAVITYEALKKNHFYKSGILTGALEETPEKLTLRRGVRNGFLYHFYKKYLHATNHIRIVCDKNNMRLEKEENFNAYKWSDNKVISYDLLLLQKQA